MPKGYRPMPVFACRASVPRHVGWGWGWALVWLPYICVCMCVCWGLCWESAPWCVCVGGYVRCV